MSAKQSVNDMSDKTSPATSQFQEMLAEGNFIHVPKIGDLVKGTVVSISRNEIHVDIDGLMTGVIRGREFYEDNVDRDDMKIGDVVEATVLEIENENGEMELSFRFASSQKAWEELRQLVTRGEIVNVEIIDANKGGLMIKLNHVPGFLPVSQLQPEHYPRVPGGDKAKILDRLKEYAGQKFEVKVLDADEVEEKLIVSEKAAWEEKQKEVIASYKVGDMVEGTVTAVTDFGVFVEFGDSKLEGLVHISELAWQRIDNPADIVKVGQQIKAEIINVEGSKIFLSMKKLIDDPWKHVAEKYAIGQKVAGKVLKVNPFGLFVELDPDIHGLAHISELSDKPIQNMTEIAQEGETKQFRIVSIEPAQHRLGLSLREPKPEVPVKDAPVAAEAAPETPADDSPKS